MDPMNQEQLQTLLNEFAIMKNFNSELERRLSDTEKQLQETENAKQQLIKEANAAIKHKQTELEHLKSTHEFEKDEIRRLSLSPTKPLDLDELLPSQVLKDIKVPFPNKFNGNYVDCDGFLVQLQNYFDMQPTRFVDDDLKFPLLGSRLEGKALKWFVNVSKESHLVTQYKNNFALCLQDFKEQFEDKTAVKKASRQIMNLKQGKAPISGYVSDFRTLTYLLNFNEEALITCFYKGLNRELKDLLFHYDAPEDLESYISLAIKLDSRIWERNMELRQDERSKNNGNQSHSANRFRNQGYSTQDYAKHSSRHEQDRSANINNSQTPKAPKDTSTPMELDNLKRGPLTHSERDDRLRKGACFYCGDTKHMRDNCPLLRSKRLNNLNLDSKSGSDSDSSESDSGNE